MSEHQHPHKPKEVEEGYPFFYTIHKLLEEILATATESIAIQKEILRVNRRILHTLQPPPRTAGIANRFSGDTSMLLDNVLVFTVGDSAVDTITPLLADGVTPSGGAVSNVVITFDDPSATFVINPDSTVSWTAAAASTAGPVTGNTACTVTDTDGATSEWNQPFTVLVNGVVPPAQLTQSIANRFVVTPGTATPKS
jgi:hypothetical protein